MATTPPAHASTEGQGCLRALGLALAIAFAALVALAVQVSVLGTVWARDLSKVPYTAGEAMSRSFVHPALVALLALGLLLARGPRARAVLLTLLASAGAAALLMLPRLVFPATAIYAPAALRLAVSLALAAPLLILAARRGASWRGGGWAVALLCAGAMALPWARLGALGDRVDTLAALAQAAGLGLLAAGLLGGVLLPGILAESGGPVWDSGLAGLTMAAALLGIGGAFGQDDLQALLMPALVGAAVPAAAVAMPGRGGRPGLLAPALLVGAAAALPLALADASELSLLVLSSGDTFVYTLRAAFTQLLVGLVLSGALLAAARRMPALMPTALAAGLAAAAWIGAGASYATGPQVGSYGNHFFVVLRQQADLGGAAQIADVAERRRFVYTTLVATADGTQAGLRQLLDSRGVRYSPFYLVNGIEVEGDVLLRQEIAQRPEVDRIVFSQALRPIPAEPAEPRGTESAPTEPAWGVHAIGADRVWSELGVTGTGVVVGQSDSGADWTHPDLRAGYRGRGGDHDYSWYDPWTNSRAPYDRDGHGTHTIGTAVGAGGIGVAPGATWFACANLVRNVGNPPDYLRCMQFMLAPFPLGGDPLRDGDPSRAADVSTNSWGCPPIEGCDQQVLLPGARALRAAGIFFVVAAGNDGPACGSLETPPGNEASAFSVGAIDSDDRLADFSSRGPDTSSPDGRTGPSLLAPGVNVLSAWPGGGYSIASGTSMATPHVAGVVALIWSANPRLRGDIAATERILEETARPYPGPPPGCGGGTPDPATGYGVVDAYAAVKRAIAMR